MFIQQEVCNGCRNCISACPYNVIGFSKATGTAHKCTLCYDRLQNDLTPACAKACPTQSIIFGDVDQLHQLADARLAAVPKKGYTKAQLYGRDDNHYAGLNKFILLLDAHEVCAQPHPARARPPHRNTVPALPRVLRHS